MSEAQKAAEAYVKETDYIDDLNRNLAGNAFLAGAAWQREQFDWQKIFDVVRHWNHHWMTKEPGYEARARLADSNMLHHLADLLKAAFDACDPKKETT